MDEKIEEIINQLDEEKVKEFAELYCFDWYRDDLLYYYMAVLVAEFCSYTPPPVYRHAKIRRLQCSLLFLSLYGR